ncbi:ankyrin repeat domain-containing protein 26 isoform X8 [Simochromis diagramma]|uniref:ankyrin repeat domain-containing protein 26 isoform X8 n=1 Tax=Simochromis diagramma TaxID=43689 RepID=UPI001A7E9BEE|nr:ankyrin repeat domain-containing protein 26 isoform X8 [Simochromis diagramma]
MKKIFSFTKKKKHPFDTPDSASRLSVGYELKDKDLGKVHKAALAGDLAKLKQLAKKNDVNQLDKENRTALHIACASGHVEVVHFLVESKAKLNLCDNQNRSALMKAVQGQHDNCVSILLENHADPNLMDINGNTALHLAANIPSVPTAVLLLQHGAQINSQNKEGFTPLIVAVRENHIEMAQFLLKETADVNSVDQDQRSPLMIAAGNGEVCMVKLLLQFDADTTLKDTKGCSADNYAGINGHHSCSHLIIEHDTQRSDRASLSHQDLSKKKKKMLSAPSQDLEAGFSLGGPATDRDEHGADEAGKDFEDNSQSESLSRVSKRAADDWPSSDDDDESVLIEKKPLKVDLSKMIASKKGEVASARADTSLSGSDSEPESENRVQRIPSLPKALSSSKSLQHPVDPTPITFLTSASHMTSTPLPHYRKKEDSTEDEEEDEGDNDKEREQEEEEEGDESAENDQLEESGESCDANSPAPEAEVSKEKKRDFLSELGLEGGEDDQSSWSSESHSENLNVDEQKRGLNSQNEGEKEEIKKNLLYVPSFVRGDRGNKMAVLEPRRSVGRPRVSQGGVASSSNDNLEGEPADQYNKVQKETERAKWVPPNVLRKPEGDVSRKTDLMEELDLGDVDDLEDASDWDSASTASMGALCGHRVASPVVEKIPECSSSSDKDQDKDDVATAALTHQKGISPDKRLPSTPSQAVPQPQPRTRKTVPQKLESEEESDWETENITSRETAENDNPLQNMAEPQTTVKPRSADPSLMEKDSEILTEFEEQQQKIGEGRTEIEVEVQKSSTSQVTSGIALEETGMGKPETSLGCMSNQAEALDQEQQPEAAMSTNRAPVQLHLPVQLTCISNKQEKQAVVETLQSELVRGARGSRAPQTNTHINGDPLCVFDDGTLSEVSDDEGSLAASGPKNNKDREEVGMAEDFDELTQSSDTATDDADSPATGYSHASLLIKKLDSATLDSTCVVKLQNIFHEYERSIKKGKDRHKYLTDKVVLLETERRDLKSSLEGIKDAKSAMERVQLELQTEVTNLKFQLKQEQENHRHTTMKYSTAADKMRRMDEEHQKEIQEMQKVHMNLELEIKRLVNNMKQLEQAHNETQRLLAQERSARTLQENLLSSHLRKNQEIEEENKRNMIKSSEVLSQLTEASDRERELLQQTASLQEQLTLLRTDFERLQTQSSLNESHLIEAREILKEELEEVRRESQLNNETMAQVVFNCKNQVTTLKSELAITTSRLENERQIREKLEEEVELSRARLAAAVKDAELCLASKSETEKALLREKEELQRLKDRFTGESASQREEVSSLSQKLAKAESQSNSMENEVHRTTMQLTEKGVLLEVLQREKDQAVARVKELEKALQTHREEVSCNKARQEATQERLVQTQSEAMLLRQQLEEAQNKGAAKERAVTDAQERFSDILSKLRSDCEERVQLLEDRNKELASKAVDLRDQVYKLEEDKNERETSLRQLQQELADSLKKLSMSEASLEVNTRYRNDLEEEKTRLLKDLDRLKGKLEESEDEYVQAERRINSLKSSLEEREKELSTAAQKLQEALSTSAASDTTIKQLEDAVQRLEIENARLEAAAKQQSNKIDALQKGAQEAAALSGCSPGGGVRSHLEDMVTNLQSSKMTLEDQLNREVQKQSLLSHTAQDSRALWEEELKGRSKLGVRLAELEKEKGELNSQMEIEKKKAKKIAEQKKAVDTRLDQEIKRNTELQKEMYRLRTLLKTAKKKVRDQDAGGAEFGSPMSSMRMDLGRHTEGHFGRMKDRVDDLQVQLEKEASLRRQLEKVNEELKDQVTSLKSMSHSNDLLERSKRQLEEEVLDLRRRMETAQVEQSHVEQYRRDAEERARQEVQQKLEQVNLFLQSQAASQEALDQIKAANEASLRSQLEQRIRELEGELGRARTSQQESVNQRESTRTELERFRQLYTEELHLRKSLAAKLERANSRLAEANSKLLNERSRSLITNGSLGAPSLDFSSLASPANYGASLGPLNRNLGLGFSLLNPVAEGQNSRMEDYLAKMQSELDRSITKELNNATAELDVASARMSPVGSPRRELDPVSRATQQYLEVLKKNSMI